MGITVVQEESAIGAICALPWSEDPIRQATLAIKEVLQIDEESASEVFRTLCERNKIRPRQFRERQWT
jgi:hypothetical protein